MRNVRERSTRLPRALANAQVELLAIGVAAFGALGMYWSTWLVGDDSPTALQSLLRDVSSLLVATGLLTFGWELVAKRAFREEVLAVAGVSESVARAGVISIERTYLDVEWTQLISRASQCDLLFIYATTWRATHHESLRTLVASPGTALRVVLPDPDDQALMEVYGRKFSKSPGDIRGRVLDAINDFGIIAAGLHAKSTIDVRVTSRAPAYSYYRFDGESVVVLYSPNQGRRPLPAIRSDRSGYWHPFFETEFDSLWEGASKYGAPSNAAPAQNQPLQIEPASSG